MYPCRPKGNTGYTYRESVALGVTALAPASVQRILQALRAQWPGHEYDLLARNCNHFCATLCEKLGVMAPPQWVNRFAGHADATVAAVTYARDQTNKAIADISSAASAAWESLTGVGRSNGDGAGAAASGEEVSRGGGAREGGSPAPLSSQGCGSTASDSTPPEEARS